MNNGHRQLLVSRLVTAIVEMHWGAKTNQARKASAVGRVQRACSLEDLFDCVGVNRQQDDVAVCRDVGDGPGRRAVR